MLPNPSASRPVPIELICELTSVLKPVPEPFLAYAIPLAALINKLPLRKLNLDGSKPGTAEFDVGPSAAILVEGLSTIVNPVLAIPPSVPEKFKENGRATSISPQSSVLIGEQPS